jgi:hypothetical protein
MPYFWPQPSATRLLSATSSWNCASDRGSGGAAKEASWSAGLMHLIGSERPTPRGSKPTMSNRSVISVGSPPSAWPKET